MKYDDAAYYTADGHSEETAIAHIALYFRWCVLRDLVSAVHTEAEDFESFKRGARPVNDYLWDAITGKLSDQDFSEPGNAFTRSYFLREYRSDLREVAGKPLMEFTEVDVDFARLTERIDQRFADWKSRPKRASWWKFW